MIPAASKPALRSSLTLFLDPGRGGADQHGGTEFGEQPGGGETDAVGTTCPGDHSHPAGQVRTPLGWALSDPSGAGCQIPRACEGGSAAARWPADGPQDNLRAYDGAP